VTLDRRHGHLGLAIAVAVALAAIAGAVVYVRGTDHLPE
jgi:hypothetical protein